MHSLIPLSLLISALSTYALNLHVEIRTPHPAVDVVDNGLVRRSTVPLNNRGNAQYIANATMGGQQMRLLLDTGSSDLWAHFPTTAAAPTTSSLGKSLTLSYAIGAAKGTIHSTPLQFDEYKIENQAFLKVEDSSSFSSDIHKQGYDGLMGLGPNEGSRVYDELDLKTTAGDSVLSRIFAANKTAENFITVLLNRNKDASANFTGQMTVNEYVKDFERVKNQPKLEVALVHRLLDAEQHWQALTDKDNGIIGPDGQIILIDSIVPKAPDGQLVAVFDSGFTFTQVPRELSDAIYGRVQNAVYDSKNEWWTVPCQQELNITFNFGGVAYPIHPMDTVDDNFGILDALGKRVCIGSFQPITSAFSLLGNYDMILGMNFLRNAYSLYNFGDWVKDDVDRADPYVQLLSLTDKAIAHQTFVSTRMAGVDSTGDAKYALLPSSQKQSSPVSEEEKKKKYQEMILSRWPYIFVGCLVGVLLIVGFVVWKCCCKRNKKKLGTDGMALPEKEKKGGFFGGKGNHTSFLPVQVPPSAQRDSTANSMAKPKLSNSYYGESQVQLQAPQTDSYYSGHHGGSQASLQQAQHDSYYAGNHGGSQVALQQPSHDSYYSANQHHQQPAHDSYYSQQNQPDSYYPPQGQGQQQQYGYVR